MDTIRDIMRNPRDSSSLLSWDALTTEQQKDAFKLYKALIKRLNDHYVIRINLKGAGTPRTNGYGTDYPHVIYPIRFSSSDDAWDYLAISPDPELRPANLKSWSIETVRDRQLVLHEPRVRSTNLIKAPPRKR